MSGLPAFRFGPDGRLPIVELRHDLPDGTWHFDWLLAFDPSPESSLVSFRSARPIHALNPGESARAERLADHRRAYLEYEGEISGGRGSVRQVQAGWLAAPVEVLKEEVGLTVFWKENPAQMGLRLRELVDESPNWTIFCVRKS